MSLPSPVQAAIFDLDGTLYHQAPLRRAMARKLVAAHLLHPLQGRQVVRALTAYRHAHEEMRSVVHDDLAAVQLDAAATRSGLDVERVRPIVEQWMEVAPLAVLPRFARADLRGALERLRHAGIRLAVLSDYPADRKLHALGVADLFDVVLCAQDPTVGVFKPQPRGLEVVLQCLGVHAADAVYVGDRPDVDAAAASAAGVAAIILGPTPSVATDDFDTFATLELLAAALVRDE